MKRVFVLGAGGMAGHIIAEFLSQRKQYKIIRCARRKITPDTILLDITEFSCIEKILAKQQPDIVINCIGLLIKDSQEHIDQAILINSYLPHFLSLMGKKYGFKLIHISTDCVFSGNKGNYTENDLRDGNTPYARTKILGEIINKRDLTLRTSIIGPELTKNGSGFLHWFLTQNNEIKGFTKVFWSGVTTLELAVLINDCIVHKIKGLVNIATPKISKFDLLLECQKIWHRDKINIIPHDSYVNDKSLISCQHNLKMRSPSTYPIMLAELQTFMNLHQEWYRHYL